MQKCSANKEILIIIRCSKHNLMQASCNFILRNPPHTVHVMKRRRGNPGGYKMGYSWTRSYSPCPVCCAAPQAQPRTFAKTQRANCSLSLQDHLSHRPSPTQGCPSQQSYQIILPSIAFPYHNAYKSANRLDWETGTRRGGIYRSIFPVKSHFLSFMSLLTYILLVVLWNTQEVITISWIWPRPPVLCLYWTSNERN